MSSGPKMWSKFHIFTDDFDQDDYFESKHRYKRAKGTTSPVTKSDVYVPPPKPIAPYYKFLRKMGKA